MNILLSTREELEARGCDALLRLIDAVEDNPGTGQSGRLRRFLLGLYNGGTFPFDLTDLRAIDTELQEAALAVLAMDIASPSVEVHHRIPGTSEVIARWAAEDWPG